VGELRDLGKRAAKILLRMQETEFKRAAEDSEASDSDAGDGDGEEAQQEENAQDGLVAQDADMPDAELSTELEAAKLRLQAKLQSDTTPEVTDEKDQVEPRDSVQQAQVLLDMIITIVGEFFGQRDLLDAREVWIRDEAVDEM
jgi:regulator of vacuolar morphogenesis